MKVECWIAVSRTGAVKLTKNRPYSTSRNIVAVRVKLDVPDVLFTEPILNVDVAVDASKVVVIEVPVDTHEVVAHQDVPAVVPEEDPA